MTKTIIENRLKRNFPNIEWKGKYAHDFETVEGFLHSNTKEKLICFKLNSFHISFPIESKNNPFTEGLDVDIFLIIYNSYGIGVLIFNVTVGKAKADDLIFLRKCFSGKSKVHIDPEKELEYDLKYDVIDKYIQKVVLSFSNVLAKSQTVNTNLIEIRNAPDFNNPESLLKRFPKEIYGLLANDEGWRFVPEIVARDRINDRWGTRDFFLIISHYSSVLSINLNSSPRCKKYASFQKSLSDSYDQKLNPYFDKELIFNNTVTGLYHGPLHTLVEATVARLLLNQVLEAERGVNYCSIGGFQKERDRIVSMMKKLAVFKIKEIDIMSKVINKGLSNIEDKVRLQEELDILERTLILKYNRSNNQLIFVVTLLGVAMTAFQFINPDFKTHFISIIAGIGLLASLFYYVLCK